MEQEKILAVMGSPGSGKTTTAVKLAVALAKRKKNVIVVFCDPFTPVLPVLLSPDAVHDTSLGALLTAPGLTQANILNACVPVPDSDYISLLGYKSGESLMQYPKITRDKAVELFVSLRYLADYIILDCAAVFEADPASFVAIETADRVLRLGTANLKGISYYQSHTPMLADSRFDKGRFQNAIGCLKVGQDWEAVSGQYGGVDHVLPYVPELEQQDNERRLFQPLAAQESAPYGAEIDRIIGDLFGLQTAAAMKGKGMKKEKAPIQSAAPQAAKPVKAKGGFKLPFAKKRAGVLMLEIRHIELSEANAYVTEYHRHHKAVQAHKCAGHRFSLACYVGGRLCGVAIVGRPRSRRIDQRTTVEVLRLCTDGTENACSKLYGACRRAAKALGYHRLITYVLEQEDGASLRASGFSYCYTNRGGSWNQPGRPRTDKAPVCPKQLYEIILNRKEEPNIAGSNQHS